MIGDDDDIFASANEPDEDLDSPAESPIAKAADLKPAADEDAADDTPPEGQQPPAAKAPAQDGQQPAQDHRIPLRELLDEREQRQRFQREAEENARQLAELRRQQQEAQRQPQDPNLMFADPEAYTRQITQTFQQQLFEQNLNFDLRLAQSKHGEVFDKAYAAVSQNPALARQMISQPSPGEAIVQWYRSQEVLREVGDDPSAYRERLQQQLLDDPNFLAKAIEKARNGATQPQGSRPQNVTRLPSLNRQTRTAEADDLDDGDDSEEAVYRSADGRFSRRR